MFSISSHQKAAVRIVVVTVVVACCLLAVGGNAFVVVPMVKGGSSISTSTSMTTATQLLASSSAAAEGSASSSSSSTSATVEDNKSSDNNNDNWYSSWAIQDSGITINEKLSLRNTNDEERGKGGMHADQKIKALEVIATIPRSLIISSVDAPVRAIEAASTANVLSWVTDITAATLVALHPSIDDNDDDNDSTTTTKKSRIDFIQSWIHGGWATQGDDLGPPESNFGPKHVTGSLMSTGSDNDHNIYAKFRMPCHPVIHRASLGLIVLTGCTEEQARSQLSLRGSTYRSLRDALEPLILNTNPTRFEKGSKRERRCWDVADILSKVLSRVTTIQLNVDKTEKACYAIVPIHERLEHSLNENTKLITSGNDILLIATRDIDVGEAITRDYTKSPKLINNNNTNDEEVADDIDIDDGSALRLLLQFGLPPNAWPEEELTVDK
ncbi:hypothetical protein FRACYDRAFT_249533 [Fragilariopsis cylindrus CCMP1102]|uniref:SET domain-containing protein n=1 Tax=Fragilariopsis cylindrus CCMP1102 TaxID=635003 RepID=A0A1E7ES07_9STRA|nr:hypothetical protein FRACYDRAFT_249533 [Fragilariopsis cylindrus CCMP1102]|eukprot:OEU08639.1 hypothetical protein FRACYDRAFT_249533 [Fragilariopsis cylindrus CCMP1102]